MRLTQYFLNLFLHLGLIIFTANGPTCSGTSDEHTRRKRVIGGDPAKVNSIPWQINFITQTAEPQQCSGNLINSEWIITTAHCFKSYDLSDYTLVAGDYSLDTKDPYEVKLHADQVFVHPSYLPAPWHDRYPGDFDIALIRLSSNVSFTPGVRPVHLPNKTTTFPPGYRCAVSGWGNVVSVSKYNRSNVLRQVQVQLVARDVCNSNISYNGEIPESFICAGYPEGGRDACFGDSGGPLQCKRSQNEWILMGMVAWGKGCAQPNKYGVYTSVKEMMPFVSAITNDGETKAASDIVKDSILRSSKVFGITVEKMAMEINTTKANLLQTSLKDVLPRLLAIEKRLIIKRMVSRLSVESDTLEKCILRKEMRVLAAKIDINDLNNNQNILKALRNKPCFLRLASVGLMEKLSKMKLENLKSLNLISLAAQLLSMKEKEVLVNLNLPLEQLEMLQDCAISNIDTLLRKNQNPDLRNLTIHEAATNVLGITRQGKCSRNAEYAATAGSYTCRCRKGFVGSGKRCRTGPGIFNVTFKSNSRDHVEDCFSFNHRCGNENISVFIRQIYANSSFSDVFVGAIALELKERNAIETLQIFDYNKDGRLPSPEGIRELLNRYVDDVTVQATDFCQLEAHNCSYNSDGRPYPGGFYCQSTNAIMCSLHERGASGVNYKTISVALGTVAALLLVTVICLLFIIVNQKKKLLYRECHGLENKNPTHV